MYRAMFEERGRGARPSVVSHRWEHLLGNPTVSIHNVGSNIRLLVAMKYFDRHRHLHWPHLQDAKYHRADKGMQNNNKMT